MARCFLATALILVSVGASHALADEPLVLEPALRHLRAGGPREWSEFPEQPDGPWLEWKFSSHRNDASWTLQLRQQDLKQTWAVLLNGKRIDRLPSDENDMRVYLDVPPGAVAEGENALRIEQQGRPDVADDVRIGEVVLHRRPRHAVLGEGTVEIRVVDSQTRQPLPARITVVNAQGTLQSVGAASDEHLAVRPGVVYTGDGQARFGLPAGKYTIYAGRGFEYSLAQVEVEVKPGQVESSTLAITREVPTDGYVACDTHTHTLTHSGHGDATVQERMLTLAAEGIELPIATDHNVQVDQEPFARQMRVRQYFTPVIGNEVTTRVGHFNVFPIEPGAALPNHQATEWSEIFDSIFATPGVKVAILNHARDVHSGVRPFDPARFNAAVGENLDGWAMRFNAMEVLNSSATQSDIWRLFYDWMALLNRGYQVTPVGSSDSHDVARHFVGQGRTYIRCDDRDPGNLDVEQAVKCFVQGRVMVSYGLLAELTVNGQYGSGELAPPSADGPSDGPATLRVALRVLGPHWIDASRVVLFANGRPIREEAISAASSEGLPPGVKWRGEWEIPAPPHDVLLTAIAIGPGVQGAYWKSAKPYQPKTPEWTPQVLGCSGAVWVDADDDGRKSSAYDYARRVFEKAGGELPRLLDALSGYDRAVAAQAAHLWQSAGQSLLAEEAQTALGKADAETQAGFRAYLEAWRECQLARAGNP